ncbi:MAG: hypothetical protein LBT79_07710 [Elusimicrobiota bacterium]|jgi:hypothetical protein|nr:hypothetical protein [Elusimicrobiota bacterium]
MPDIYFNSDVGCANKFEIGKNCVIDAAKALFVLDKELGCAYIEYSTEIRSFKIAQENGVAKYIQDIFPVINKERGANIDILRYLLEKFSKGNKVNPQKYNEWIIDELDLNSPILECAVKNNAMSLSFAADGFWKKDFIKFKRQDKQLPNIWGQKNLSPIKNWIEQWYKNNDDFTEILKREFNIKFCQQVENDFIFNASQQDKIISILSNAKNANYQYVREQLELWKGDETDIGALKELRMVSDGIRIFLVYHNKELIIGGICKKSGQSDKLQQKAARKAVERINLYVKQRSRC